MSTKLLIVSFLLLSFSYPKTDNKNIMKTLSIIKGSWQMQTRKGSIIEEWDFGKHNNYIGKSFKTTYNDTILMENLEIKIIGKSIYYIASVLDQNNQNPIYFKLIKFNNNTYTFENKKHDYPQQITYNFVTNDSLIATISGSKNNKILSSKFIYNRIL